MKPPPCPTHSNPTSATLGSIPKLNIIYPVPTRVLPFLYVRSYNQIMSRQTLTATCMGRVSNASISEGNSHEEGVSMAEFFMARIFLFSTRLLPSSVCSPCFCSRSTPAPILYIYDIFFPSLHKAFLFPKNILLFYSV